MSINKYCTFDHSFNIISEFEIKNIGEKVAFMDLFLSHLSSKCGSPNPYEIYYDKEQGLNLC